MNSPQALGDIFGTYWLPSLVVSAAGGQGQMASWYGISKRALEPQLLSKPLFSEPQFFISGMDKPSSSGLL